MDTMDTTTKPADDMPANERKALARVEQHRAKLKTARGDLQGLQRELADEEHDAGLGAPEARQRADVLRRQVTEQDQVVQAAQQAVETAEAEHRQLVSLRQQREEEERIKSIPRLDAEVMDAAHRVERLARELADAINECANGARRLGDAIGTPEAQRVLGIGGVAMRVSHCLVNTFVYQNNRPHNESPLLAGDTHAARMFDFFYNHSSPLCKTPFSVATRQALDAVVTTFATEADALAARARIDPSGARLHVLSVKGLWQLATGALRGAAARLRRDEAGGRAS
jgi:hypothetical protein